METPAWSGEPVRGIEAVGSLGARCLMAPGHETHLLTRGTAVAYALGCRGPPEQEPVYSEKTWASKM